MKKYTIMLACAAGMSTSLLVTKMKNAAKEKEIDTEIFATSATDVDEKIKEKDPDILLLGPQVRYLLNDFKNKLSVPVDVINMQDYGQMNGAKVLEFALGKIPIS